ncbi:MAG: thiamine pyrophosphate-binding protein [Chloroflexi bacterium]|nr:thiamine pyrophosphate-binding protein [Chloroflexota bacterium]
MVKATAGAAVVEALRAEGVRYVFGIVAHTFQPMIEALYGQSDIRFVSGRHEQGSAFMADGFARASGLPGVCVAVSGPGVTNLMTGVLAAYQGHSPVIALAGGIARRGVHRGAPQEADNIGIMRPVTKDAIRVESADRIPDLFRHAFRQAMAGKKGPVFIELPMDVLESPEFDADILSPDAYRVHHRVPGDPEQVRRAAQLLTESKRPVIIAGGGVNHSGATREVVELAELLSIPMVTPFQGNDAVPNAHPLYVGSLGTSPARAAPEAAELCAKADVIVAIGSRLNGATTGYDNRFISKDARIIQIEIDEEEIGRSFPITVGIHGDAKAVLQDVLAVIRAQGTEGGDPRWKAEATALKARRRARLDAEARLSGMPLKPQRVYGELRKVIPPEAIVTLDAGTCPGIGFDRLEFQQPRTLIAPGDLGGLGFAFPEALGAKLGRPEAPVIAIHGDGGFLYNSQELETAVREKIATVTIVMNNNEWGSEKLIELRRDPNRLVGVDITNPRFDKLAELYGARGFYVERAGDLGDAVKAALASGLPSVIEVPVEPIGQTLPVR